MKKKTHFLLLVLSLFLYTGVCADGKLLFRQNCAACHTIGKGRMVGPDLDGINEKRSEKWLLDFIKSSQKVIKSGDSEAMKLFVEYNKLVMPDQTLSEEEIRSILSFVGDKNRSVESSTGAAQTTEPESKPIAQEEVYQLEKEPFLTGPARQAEISELFNKGSLIGLSLCAILLACITLILLKKLL